MGGLFLVLGVSIAIAGVFGVLYVWAVRNGQWDDLDTPAHRILTEELDEKH